MWYIFEGKTVDIIKFAQFEKGNLWSETHNLISETHEDTESGNEYDDYSTIAPLISEEEMDARDSGDESDDEPFPTEMLEDICDGSQSHPNVNMS